MPIRYLLLAVLVCCPSAAWTAQKTYDLILVAGQSNAVGFDAKPEDLPPDESDQEVLFWWRSGDPPPDEHDSTSGGVWTHLKPQHLGNPIKPRKNRQYGNFAQPSGGFGPEVGLARSLKRTGAKNLAIVKAAFSGTGIRRDWNPESAGPDGACYRSLVEEYRKAAHAAGQQGIRFRIRALVWVQGESDSGAGEVGHYEDALVGLVNTLRKDLSAPDMVALLGVNTRFLEGQRDKEMARIVASQKTAAKRIGRSAYVDTSACSIANRVHFDAAGTLRMGELFAEALRKAENR